MLLSDVLRLERPLIGVDTETTGTNPTSSRIVELALEIYAPDKPVREYRTLINPLMKIPPGATAVHGITDAMVTGCRVCGLGEHDDTSHAFARWPTFDQVADNLLIGFTGSDFCGYNVRFDLRMLSAEFKRVKRLWDYEDARVLDAFRLWQVAEGRSLGDAIDRFLTKEERGDGAAHNALNDVRWSTRVLASQLKAFSRLPRDLQQLHDLCSPGWFDAEGKLQWREGALCISFGQHRDTPISRVPKSYLSWITKGDFSAKVKLAAQNAIKGIYPDPPPQGPPMEDE